MYNGISFKEKIYIDVTLLCVIDSVFCQRVWDENDEDSEDKKEKTEEEIQQEEVCTLPPASFLPLPSPSLLPSLSLPLPLSLSLFLSPFPLPPSLSLFLPLSDTDASFKF